MVHAPPDNHRHQHGVERPCGETECAAVGCEHLESVLLDADYRSPPPFRWPVGLHRLAVEVGADVVREQPVGPVARRRAKRIGRGDVADGEHAAMSRNTQIRFDPHEAVLVEQLGGQPVGVGPHASDGPEHGIGVRFGLSGSPANGIVGDFVAPEPVGDLGAVPRVQRHAGAFEPALDAFPHARVMPGHGALAGEVQVDLLVRPRDRDVRRTADGRGAATDHDHRTRPKPTGRGARGGRRRCRRRTAGSAGARSRSSHRSRSPARRSPRPTSNRPCRCRRTPCEPRGRRPSGCRGPCARLSSARKRSNGIQFALAQCCGRLSRQPSSWPLTRPGLAEIPTTSKCRASRIAVRTPLSPSPATTTRLRCT